MYHAYTEILGGISRVRLQTTEVSSDKCIDANDYETRIRPFLILNPFSCSTVSPSSYGSPHHTLHLNFFTEFVK